MTGGAAAEALPPIGWAQAYRLRLKRRQLLLKALRARRRLQPLQDRTAAIRPGAVLGFTVLRNEALRLPFFLDHYRALGVDHFLVADNGSDDGSADYLAAQPDVSLWQTGDSYLESRFGLDWLGWLLMRYGHGHWCLTADADELLVYNGHRQHGLRALTGWLEAQGRAGFGALMLDLYPEDHLGTQAYAAGQDPLEVIPWFDAGPYRSLRQHPRGNLWVQGGARERMFFADCPERSPTLNKLPLMKWNRRWAYTNSTHALLPRGLNGLYSGPGGAEPSGVLLHTKFLPEIVSKSEIEKQRGQHFTDPQAFDGYYDSLTAAPRLCHADAQLYTGTGQLESLGLMTPLPW